jgi:hypothetical protein
LATAIAVVKNEDVPVRTFLLAVSRHSEITRWLALLAQESNLNCTQKGTEAAAWIRAAVQSRFKLQKHPFQVDPRQVRLELVNGVDLISIVVRTATEYLELYAPLNLFQEFAPRFRITQYY